MAIAARKLEPNSKGQTALRIAPAAPKRQIAPMLIGAMVIVVGALISGLAASRAGDRVAVLAVVKPVTAGQIIGSNDVEVVRLSTDAQLKPIAASAESSVVGHPAAVTLVPGTLLTSDAIGPASVLPSDQSQVGVSLKAGQYPPGLAPGQSVRIIDTDPLASATLVEDATVVSVAAGSTDESGSAIVGLQVPAEDMNAVAVACEAGHVSLGLVGS